MQLIRSSEKNTKKISCAKTRVENEEQDQTRIEKLDETEEEDSHNSETS